MKFLCIIFLCLGTVCHAQTVIDNKGTKVPIDTSKWKLSGTNISNKNSGNVGIGVTLPLYKLDVNNTTNPVRITGLANGAAADSIITIQNGVIRKIPAGKDSTTASNGLSETGNNIVLGGTLNNPTTINTSSTNTLTLTGLQTGTSSDSVLVVTAGSGVIKKILSPASLPQLLVHVKRNTTYTTTAAYATLVYNSVIINTGAVYNTTTGIFTAPVTGIYQFIINNSYSWPALNNQIGNQIIVNGAVEADMMISNYPTITGTNASISAGTIVSMNTGQTASISVGNLVGGATPLIGTGQHLLKIIRLQ